MNELKSLKRRGVMIRAHTSDKAEQDKMFLVPIKYSLIRSRILLYFETLESEPKQYETTATIVWDTNAELLFLLRCVYSGLLA